MPYVAEDGLTLDEITGLLTEYNCMTIMELHGFFTALASNPTLITPSTWLEITGIDAIEFNSDRQADLFHSTIMSMYDDTIDIIGTKKYFPLCTEITDEEIKPIAYAQWCDGYLTGIELDFEQWDNVGEDEIKIGLAHLHSFLMDDEELGPYLAKDDDTETDIQQMIKEFRSTSDELFTSIITGNYFYWKEQRAAPTENTDSNKHGRNDPCPCGSGNKYKKCCLH